MFKHTLTKLLLLSIGFSCSLLPAERNTLRNPDIKAKKTESSRTNPQTPPTQPANPAGNFSSLNVAGNEKIGGDLTVVNDLTVGDNLSASTIALQTNLTVGAALNVNGCVNINNNLKIDSFLNTESVNADTAIICKEICQSLDACKNTTDSLTVVNNARIGGIAYAGEIDPLDNKTTCFSGNVAINDKKILLVNEINPVKCICCPCDDKSPRGCSTGCAEKCIEDDCGTICFSGNMAVKPPKPVPVGQDPFVGIKKLLVNAINPVKLDACGNCIPDEDGTTCMSGNVVLGANPTLNCNDVPVNVDPTRLLVNEINPVTMIDNGVDACGNPRKTCVPDDIGTTCFPSGMAIDGNHTLYVTEIDPVATDDVYGDDYAYDPDTFNEYDLCFEDTRPCAFTQFSGNIRLSNKNLMGNNSHIIGQLSCTNNDPSCIDQTCNPIMLQPDSTTSSILQYPVTECEPVLRLSFTNTDTTQTPFPQGAWVKLTVFGLAQVDGGILFDVCSQLYFYVGAGYPAQCSAFVGSLNGIGSANTLSSTACVEDAYEYNFWSNAFNFPAGPSVPPFPPTGQLSRGSLFGLTPIALDALSAPAIIGTTASSSTLPNSVDILLMGVLPPNTGFPPASTFQMTDITIFYDIISSNLDPANPPCVPVPALDTLDLSFSYTTACCNLLATLTSNGNLPGCIICNDPPTSCG